MFGANMIQFILEKKDKEFVFEMTFMDLLYTQKQKLDVIFLKNFKEI